MAVEATVEAITSSQVTGDQLEVGTEERHPGSRAVEPAERYSTQIPRVFDLNGNGTAYCRKAVALKSADGSKTNRTTASMTQDEQLELSRIDGESTATTWRSLRISEARNGIRQLLSSSLIHMSELVLRQIPTRSLFQGFVVVVVAQVSLAARWSNLKAHCPHARLPASKCSSLCCEHLLALNDRLLVRCALTPRVLAIH